jgi:hypothetical protein
MENHVHRFIRLGAPVLVRDPWYKKQVQMVRCAGPFRHPAMSRSDSSASLGKRLKTIPALAPKVYVKSALYANIANLRMRTFGIELKFDVLGVKIFNGFPIWLSQDLLPILAADSFVLLTCNWLYIHPRDGSLAGN